MKKRIYVSSLALVALTFTSQMAFSMNPDEAGSSSAARSGYPRPGYPRPDEAYDFRGNLRANEAGETELSRLRAELAKTKAEIAKARRAGKTPEDEDRNNRRLMYAILDFRKNLEGFVGRLDVEGKPVPDSLYTELDALQAEADPLSKRINDYRRSQETPPRSSVFRIPN